MEATEKGRVAWNAALCCFRVTRTQFSEIPVFSITKTWSRSVQSHIRKTRKTVQS